MNNSQSGGAVAPLVLGIISVAAPIVFSVYGSVIGLVCGIIAIIMGSRARKEQPGGMSTAGFVLGIIGVVISSMLFASCLCLVNVFTSNSFYY